MSKTPEQIRIEQKLKLWETPGFFQFLEDLADEMSAEADLACNVHYLKLKYSARLMELEPKGPFKQGELEL